MTSKTSNLVCSVASLTLAPAFVGTPAGGETLPASLESLKRA